MNICNIVGRVIKATVDTNQNQKRVGKVRIEVRKKFGEKTFSTRFDCHVYGQEAEFAGSLAAGTIAWASGEVSAYLNEYKGKTYANLQLTGRVGVVDCSNFEEHKRQFEGEAAQPRTNSPAPTQKKEKPAELPPGVDVEDDVPF